jgi:hypothetical protein
MVDFYAIQEGQCGAAAGICLSDVNDIDWAEHFHCREGKAVEWWYELGLET